MSPKTMRLLAKPMLFAAALIWGTSFFIMKNALDVMPVFFLLAIRFTAGAALLAGGAGIFIPLPDAAQYSVLAAILAVMALLFLRMRHTAARGTV